jgi:hypothetical protein
MYYIGCDPGEEGAVAGISVTHSYPEPARIEVVGVQLLLPVNKAQDYLDEQMRFFLNEMRKENDIRVMIEIPYARYGKYSLITSYGWLRGFFGGMKIPFKTVKAAEWQKIYQIDSNITYGQRKKLLLKRAQLLFGEDIHMQIADAALIAFYAYRKEPEFWEQIQKTKS